MKQSTVTSFEEGLILTENNRLHTQMIFIKH